METPWSRIFSGLTFKVATASERTEALARRGEIYELELGHRGTDDFDTEASHLVAINAADGRVVSAMRIILQRPLEIERHLDLVPIVGQNNTIAQIGGFWVDDQWRVVDQNRFLQIGMLKLALMFGRANQITQFYMYTYARLSPLYRAAFFEDLRVTFIHPVWGRVSVLRLDLRSLADKCATSKTAFARLLALDRVDNFTI